MHTNAIDFDYRSGWQQTDHLGLDELPPIPWDPPPLRHIPVGEVRELFGKAGVVQWNLAVRLQESAK